MTIFRWLPALLDRAIQFSIRTVSFSFIPVVVIDGRIFFHYYFFFTATLLVYHHGPNSYISTRITW